MYTICKRSYSYSSGDSVISGHSRHWSNDINIVRCLGPICCSVPIAEVVNAAAYCPVIRYRCATGRLPSFWLCEAAHVIVDVEFIIGLNLIEKQTSIDRNRTGVAQRLVCTPKARDDTWERERKTQFHHFMLCGYSTILMVRLYVYRLTVIVVDYLYSATWIRGACDSCVTS